MTRAHHVEHSAAIGDPDAIAVLTEAGHTAAESAPAAAAHWFAAALRLLPDDTDATSRAELLAPLALSAGAAGRFEDSRTAVDELLTLVPAELAPIRVELVAFRAFLDYVTGRLRDARTITERELRALDEAHVAERPRSRSSWPTTPWCAPTTRRSPGTARRPCATRRPRTRCRSGSRPARWPRSATIAELVATGSTNRQIAARLVISEKTVETHITRILRKLALESRAAVGQAINRTTPARG